MNSVLARAARNTPWVGAVWARALNALERGGAPDAEQAAMYEKAITAGLQVLKRYISEAYTLNFTFQILLCKLYSLNPTQKCLVS